jgi:hypothetical protein
MRLWSLHPRHLDAKGLVALWREGLLAQNVLLGKTRGYRNHPQLNRFKDSRNPVGAIASYLRCVVDEANRRGYHFDRSKIVNKRIRGKLPVTSGQLEFELEHLLRKLKARDPAMYKVLKSGIAIEPHCLFRKVKGNVEQWEIV